MSPRNLYDKTDELVLRFKNGRERYRTSPTFNVMIQMLARGESEYDVIDTLCQRLDDQIKAFEQYALRDTRPPRFYPD